MASFDIYGFRNDTFDDDKIQLENILSITLEEHESAYRGGRYFRYGNFEEEHFEFQKNIDLLGEEPAEPDFEQYPLLLYVNRTERSDFLCDLINKNLPCCSLLKHEVI